MTTTTTKFLSLFTGALILSLVCACTDPSASGVNSDSLAQDSLFRDSVLRDSLRIDSLRIDSIAQLPPKLSDSSFIPKEYMIKDIVYGDLNLDMYPDAIVVLCCKDEEWMDERSRPVFILTGDSSRNYEIALRNDHLTPPREAGQMFGEPYNGIEIDSGTFVVKHYGGSRFRWTCDYVFEYDRSKQSWFYVKNFGSIGDMLGEMNELDSTGQCIPYDSDTLVISTKVDIRNFDCATAQIAELEY